MSSAPWASNQYNILAWRKVEIRLGSIRVDTVAAVIAHRAIHALVIYGARPKSALVREAGKKPCKPAKKI